MVKKYYAIFWTKDDPDTYAMMFKIKGSLIWDPKFHCFQDKDWYVRSVDDVICYAARDTHPSNWKQYGGGFLVDHKMFIFKRGQGCKRFEPENKIINWD